ncbi:MAG: hypothetical protein DMF64_01595 [Acidobacteria bacterium]|nr:MAG: hypothetical protein DMF64_01595 [Acidobacteriota bacterium]
MPERMTLMSNGSYFNFDKLISSSLIKLTYTLGMMALTIFGVGIIGYAIYTYANTPPALQNLQLTITVYQSAIGIGALVLGNLIWRVLCETWILLFSMHDQLIAIRDELRARP